MVGSELSTTTFCQGAGVGHSCVPAAAPWQNVDQNHFVGGFAPLLGPLARRVRSLLAGATLVAFRNRHRTATATCLPNRLRCSRCCAPHPPSETSSDEPCFAPLSKTSRVKSRAIRLWGIECGERCCGRKSPLNQPRSRLLPVAPSHALPVETFQIGSILTNSEPTPREPLTGRPRSAHGR